MIEISIDNQLKNIAPNLALGVLNATVTFSKHDNDLWKEINSKIDEIALNMNMDMIYNIPEFEALRYTYRKLGKDPTRYRGSAEALVRRILQKKDLYKVNTIVDINNLISLETLRPVGSYNLTKIGSSIVFRIGRKDESYEGIGKDIVNISNLPVFADEIGAFGSPTSDSVRSMITQDTTKVMMIIISFTGSSSLQSQLKHTSNLLCKYVKASPEKIETLIVE